MKVPLGTFLAHKKAASTPKLGEVKPIDIFSLARRKIDKRTVDNLAEALKRDGRFLHPIVVRDEGAARYRLIAGGNRLEAWERCFGEEQPISALIYSTHTPDAQITALELEENLLRNELTLAERKRQTILLAAALKKLNGGVPVRPVSDSDEAAETGNQVPSLPPASGGRGNKGLAQKVAEKVGITKRAVNKRVKAAEDAIGEKIDLDRDTPEELERKAAELERRADKRQRAEPTVEQPKRRKPALPSVSEDPTPPTKPHAGDIDSQIEAWLKAFDALGRTYQLRLVYHACIRLGFDPLMMASPAVFGLADEEPELAVDTPAELTLATDDAPVAQAEQRDDAADLGAEDLPAADGDASGDTDYGGAEDADDNVSDAVDQEDSGAEDLQITDDVGEAADQEPGEPATCANCHFGFGSNDPSEVINGRLYHRRDCAAYGRRIASAAG